MEYVPLIKVFHIVGMICLFLGFGGLFGIGENRSQINKIVFGLHGLGLLLLFLTGFAIQGMAIKAFPMWLIAKIVIWILMAVILVLVKRKVISTPAGVFSALLLGGVVAWLCLLKPFT